MARSLKDKLYLSGMDGQAAALARQWHVGYEITAFSYAPMLDAPETAERVRRDMAGVERFWLHGPFAELSPCAIDPLVRQTAQHRFHQQKEQKARGKAHDHIGRPVSAHIAAADAAEKGHENGRPSEPFPLSKLISRCGIEGRAVGAVPAGEGEPVHIPQQFNGAACRPGPDTGKDVFQQADGHIGQHDGQQK